MTRSTHGISRTRAPNCDRDRAGLMQFMAGAVLSLAISLMIVGCSSEDDFLTIETTTVVAKTPTSTAALNGPPDLVIDSFSSSGHEWTLSGGLIANVEIVVRNVGLTPATPGTIAVVAKNRTDAIVEFSFPDGEARREALDTGAAVTVTGAASLSWHGNFDVTCGEAVYDPELCAMRTEDTVWLLAIVDYCGDNGSTGCTIEEVSETNNTSPPIEIPR